MKKSELKEIIKETLKEGLLDPEVKWSIEKFKSILHKYLLEVDDNAEEDDKERTKEDWLADLGEYLNANY